MTLYMNYLNFTPTTVGENGQTIGGFTWWGKTGGTDIYIGNRNTNRPNCYKYINAYYLINNQ